MNKIDIYFRDEMTGGALLTSDGVLVTTNASVRRLLESMRKEGQTDEELFKSLPERLRGQTWCREVE